MIICENKYKTNICSHYAAFVCKSACLPGLPGQTVLGPPLARHHPGPGPPRLDGVEHGVVQELRGAVLALTVAHRYRLGP